MSGILLDPNMETLPVIREDDYRFCWTTLELVAITNRFGETRFYSVPALKQIARSNGMPAAVRRMAEKALGWIDEQKEGGR